MDNIEKLLQQILETQKNMHNDITEIKEKQAEHDKRFDKLEQIIHPVDEQVQVIANRAYNIENQVKELVEDFRTVEIVTSKNMNDIAKLKAVK